MKKATKPEPEKEVVSNAASEIKRILSHKKYEHYRESVVEAKEVVKYRERVSTSSLNLDLFLEGGFRCGMSRFSGPEQHGKTMQALTWAKNWQKTIPNSFVLYFAGEGRLTQEDLDKSGIDQSPEKLSVAVNNEWESTAQFVYDVIKDNPSHIRYFMVFDSTDSFLCKDDIDKPFEDGRVIAGGARMASFFGAKASVMLASRGHHVCLLGQLRSTMSSQGPGKGGSGTSGGRAFGFYSSLTGKIEPMSDFAKSYIYAQGAKEEAAEDEKKEKPIPIGHYFAVKFTKTQNEKNLVTIRVPIKRNHGIWTEMEIFDLSVMYGLLKKKGSWYEFDAEFHKQFEELGLPVNFQGMWPLINALEAKPELTEAMAQYFRATFVGNEG